MALASVPLGAGGHGIFTQIAIFSAPASVLGTAGAWLGCIPIGAILAACCTKPAFPMAAAIHYFTALFAVAMDLSDLAVLWSAPAPFQVFFGVAMLWYFAGHGLLWAIHGARTTEETASEPRDAASPRH